MPSPYNRSSIGGHFTIVTRHVSSGLRWTKFTPSGHAFPQPATEQAGFTAQGGNQASRPRENAPLDAHDHIGVS